MRREPRDYNPDGTVNRVGLTYTWPLLDEHARFTIRRNYRWLRQRDVSPTMCRLILDTTLTAMQGSMGARSCLV